MYIAITTSRPLCLYVCW